MNNLKTYFASPVKSCTNGTAPPLLPVVSPSKEENFEDSEKVAKRVFELQSANGADVESHEHISPLYIIKKPSVNSKLILQNMEEVLNSVKKKHRQKHRRKKEQKKLAQLEAEAVAMAMKTKADAEISSSSHTDTMHGLSKKPLCENSGQGRKGEDHTPKLKPKQSQIKKTPLKRGTVPKHTTSPDASGHTLGSEINEHSKVNTRSKEKEPPRKAVIATTNAFEVLMNARNKSIGSNSPGKEVTGPEEAATPTRNIKRKLLLQEWADRKGGNKRKVEEESRAAYVEEQLERRAKRFKKMLTTAVSSSKATPDSQEFTRTRKSKRKESSRISQNKNVENEIQKSKRPHCNGKRRSTSNESVGELSGEGLRVEDVDTIEFLEKLSSPTKKRDNLLGFFSKKETQKTDPKVVNELGDSHKRQRRSNFEKRNTREDILPFKEVQKDEATTPVRTSDRPRRSCADKARYDYDLEVSPTKLNRPPKTPKPTGPHTIVVSDEEIEVHDLGNIKSKSKVSQEKKLAPLFSRTLPKPSLDPTLVKARQDFLMSGVPEKLRIEQFKQKQFEQNYEEALELFPKTSHIQQLTTSEMDWLEKSVTFTFKWQLMDEDSSLMVAKTRRSKAKKVRELGSLTRCREHATVSAPLLSNEPLPSVPDKRLIIKAWKTDYERFPIYRCYNQMREKYRYFSAIDSGQDTQQVTESFVFTRRSLRSTQGVEPPEQDVNLDDAKPPAMAPNGELMFTEKYKPLFFEQFLVNLSPVSELRDFLVNWAAGSRGSQGASETLDSDNDSNSSNHHALCNTVVLLGPSSSGKTSSVFAVANELNFNVLEINAGMKRTGKKLIQELQEATQSHQLRKNASAQSKTQKSVLKLSLDGLKSKAKQSKNLDGESNSSGNGAESNTTAARKCLILIEDADIVFDQVDAGFTDAIYTLAASSKRPVIIVASNLTCPHLQRLIHQNTIYFKEPNTLNISRYMSVLALLENCPINLDDLISLYIYNKKDLRKTLLELQFFIQSGGDRMKEEQIESETPALFASPTKRRFSEESNHAQGTANDDLPNKETAAVQPDVVANLHIHQHLFNFFTTPQNQNWRIPYPVDFNLLRHNLGDIFQVSKKFEGPKSPGKPPKPVECTTKRKSRSPKKVWLTAAAAQQVLPLADLCAFYENVSIACLLGLRGNEKSALEETRPCDAHVMAKDIVYNLVANAIDCNLEAKQFAYNLIYSPMQKLTLADGLANVVLRNRNSLALDFEPTLRSICRSEKLRAAEERRSTRFYHYLRNSSDIPGERLRNACMVFTKNEDSCSQAPEQDAVDSTKT